MGSSHYTADGKNSLGGPDIAKRQQVATGTLLYLLRSRPCEDIDRLQAGLAREANTVALGEGLAAAVEEHGDGSLTLSFHLPR